MACSYTPLSAHALLRDPIPLLLQCAREKPLICDGKSSPRPYTDFFGVRYVTTTFIRLSPDTSISPPHVRSVYLHCVLLLRHPPKYLQNLYVTASLLASAALADRGWLAALPRCPSHLRLHQVGDWKMIAILRL